MLRSLRELDGYTLEATDGEIGHCRDFLFDDESWAVRYMVADTGGWLSGRQVLISPAQLGEPAWNHRRLPVELTRQQIEDSPPLDSDAPVSRQYELTFNTYHSLPAYWLGSGLWGSYPLPTDMTQPLPQAGLAPEPPAADEAPEPTGASAPPTHLRSLNEVGGYGIFAAGEDGRGGRLVDLIFDEHSWAVRHLLMDTSRLPFSKKVLVPVEQVARIDWAERRIDVGTTLRALEEAPEYDPHRPLNDRQEAELYDYYRRRRGTAEAVPDDRR
jgi:hypothetical protein